MEFSTRKVQKVRSSFLISLPKPWSLSSGLKAGDEVTVIAQRDGSLSLYPKKMRSKITREIVINVDPKWKGNVLSRNVISAYLNGYDVIRLSFPESSAAAQNELSGVLRNLTGLSILEKDLSQIVLKCILDPFEIPIEQSLRRASTIAFGMHEDAISSLKEGDVNLAKKVIRTDIEVDRLYFLLARQLRLVALNMDLAGKLKLTILDSIDYSHVMRRLEHIADHACKIAINSILMHRSDISDSLIEILVGMGKKSLEIHECASKALFSKNIVLANKAVEGKPEIELMKQIIEESIVAYPSNIVLYTALIVDSFDRIADYCTDIAEVAIERYVYR
jgi:phosphate uptake regulator